MATEPPRLRAVFDTNAIIAALKSHHPASPNAELLQRWESGKFALLYSSDLRAKYVEKFSARGVDAERSRRFLITLAQRGILIPVSPSDVVPVVLADPDDDVIVACAVVGTATHIITYDPHFDLLRKSYHGIQIVRPLDFLYLVRGDVPPNP